MIGVINILNERIIKGWAASYPNAEEEELELYVNGILKGKTIANETRDYLVKKKQHNTGKCGFSFDISEMGIDVFEDHIEVRISSIVQLTKSGQRNFRNAKRAHYYNNENVFFFIHIPKTAGTSFRNMLYKQFGQDKVYPNLEDIAINGNRYPKYREVKELIEQKFNTMRLFCGHYTYAMGKELFGQYFTPLVFLRDPVERTISLLYQLQRMREKYRSLNLEQIFDLEMNQVTNVQTYYMNGKVPPTKQTEQHLNVAISNIKKLKIFGIVERFSESKKRFEKEYGWKLGIDQNLNKNPRKNSEISTSLRDKIKAVNNLDEILYRNALKQFDEY